MLMNVIVEGIGLSVILFIICAAGIRKGAVGMVHLYHKDVQDKCVELGLTTHEQIRKRAMKMKFFAMPLYLLYVLVCVYAVNGVRSFWPGFLHVFLILSIMNLFDRLGIDLLWVEHTEAWTIPGTEALKPYINRKDKVVKWIVGTVGAAILAIIVSGVMAMLLNGNSQL